MYIMSRNGRLLQGPTATAYVNRPGGLLYVYVAPSGSFIASWAIAARAQIIGGGMR